MPDDAAPAENAPADNGPAENVPTAEASVFAASDYLWMARALEQARLAGTRGEVPVGAVVVKDGALLAEGHNLTVTTSDPTAHAEVVAIRNAAALQGDWRLEGTTLYCTLEPCTQCCGAIVLGRIPRVVYGAADPKAGMAESLGNLLQDSRLNHRAEVNGGISAETSSALLRTFFRARR